MNEEPASLSLSRRNSMYQNHSIVVHFLSGLWSVNVPTTSSLKLSAASLAFVRERWPEILESNLTQVTHIDRDE